MENIFEPIDTTMNSTVADVKINNMDIENTTTTVTYEIKQPVEYKNDFYVNLRASDIKKVRKYCDDAQKSNFPLSEILLATATTCIGCFLGALASNVQLNSTKGILMYLGSLVIGTGTAVAYFFVRKNTIKDINALCNNIKEFIVDPENL